LLHQFVIEIIQNYMLKMGDCKSRLRFVEVQGRIEKTNEGSMMKSIWTMGEILVEVMRPRVDMPLDQAGEFLGPFPSGAPAIFIDTVARLGHAAGIIGGVGEDDFGSCVLRRLEGDGVDCRYVRCYPGYATAVAFVTYFADGSRKFLYHIDRTPAVMTGFTSTETIQDAAFFHIMGCSLMASDSFREQIFRAMNVFCQQGAKISFDPNIRAELLRDRPLEQVVGPVLERCAVLLPGEAELALLSGDQDAQEGARRLFERYPLELIVLKRGKQGCTLFSRAGDMPGTPLDVPAYPVAEIDPTGAGDCFDAGFLCGMLEEQPLEDCARIAAAAGALNAAAFGPMEGEISRERVERVMKTGRAG
jgi:sugar/nucleoside kinase (ribokinase family)